MNYKTIYERKSYMKKYTSLVLSVLLVGSLILGCGVAGTACAAEQIPTTVTAGQDNESLNSEASLITLSDSGVSFTGEGVSLSGSTVTISAEGSYILTGTLSQGQIRIDAPEDAKVKLLLNGVSLSNSGDAAIYALSADKVVLSTVSGSVIELNPQPSKALSSMMRTLLPQVIFRRLPHPRKADLPIF